MSTAPGSSLASTSHSVSDAINNALAPLNNNQQTLSTTDIHSFVKQVLPSFIKAFIGIVVGLASSLPVLITSAILYGFLFNTFTLHGASLGRILKTISPFEDETSNLYLDRSGSIVKASLQGQFLIAVIMGLSCAFLLFPLGLQSYFIFFFIVFTLLGMVPLGTGIVVVPLAILAMLTGQFWPGFWVLLIYVFIICNMDNFLRPRMMPKNAKLLPALTTLSTFCGLYYFGILGVVYGPLIAVLLVTTLETYTVHRQAHRSLTGHHNKGGQVL
jgi:predicted PurR-regulated permease PerM